MVIQIQLSVADEFCVIGLHACQGIIVEVIELHEILSAGPIVVGSGDLENACKGAQLIQGNRILSRKPVKQRFVEVKGFAGFRNGQHQKRLIKISLRKEGGGKGRQLFLGKIIAPGQQVFFPNDLHHAGIGRKQVRHFLCTRLAVGRGRQRLIDGRGAGDRHHIDRDAMLPSHSFIKFVYGIVHRRFCLTSVNMPHGQCDRIFRAWFVLLCAPGKAGDEKQRTENDCGDLFHGSIPFLCGYPTQIPTLF